MIWSTADQFGNSPRFKCDQGRFTLNLYKREGRGKGGIDDRAFLYQANE